MSKSIKVGVFVLSGLILLGIAVFMIGDNRNLWDPKIRYQAAFFDVAGLKPGAPVRMGGVDVGTVVGVAHGDKVEDTRVYVTLSVTKREAVRVREDTVGRVVNKGLLGDKMIELSSDGRGPELGAGKMLKTEEPVDFGKYVAKFDEIATKASKAVDNIEQGTRPLADPQFAEDLKKVLHNAREVTDGLAHSDSVLHRVIMDPHEGQKFDAMLNNMQLATNDLQDMTSHLRKGPGLAHAIVYDGQMTSDVAGSLAEVHKDLRQIREGNGLVHTLVYGDTDTQHLMTNVNAMSDDLREVVHGLKTGKGTLGALLVDPSVYEDIKSIVGNVERNQVLRALVRYSIKADESRPAPRVEPTSSK
jgi:phospholipid/cholesterol/gamma-HCH transport system substrate-binding protein